MKRDVEVPGQTQPAERNKHGTTRRSCAISVAEGYERWAPNYDHFPNPLLAREERHLLPLLTDLHGKRVLDLACGTGRWLETLTLQEGTSGAGVDCSIAMLRVGSTKRCIAGRLARATSENLPFGNAVFDLAICSFALGHLTDWGSTLRELARVTRPRADVFISDLHPDSYARGWRVGFRDEGSALEIEMLPREAEEIVQMFCSNGFESIARWALCLGEQEKPIFVRAGKADTFAQACQSPAVLVCHFKRQSAGSIQLPLEGSMEALQ